jgi:hypothetical protein
VSVKLNVIRSELAGKRVVIIDDSIVRGTTSRRLVSLLREAGAKEVHFRVCSPPVRYPCYFGIDIAHRKELIGIPPRWRRSGTPSGRTAWRSYRRRACWRPWTARRVLLGLLHRRIPVPTPGEGYRRCGPSGNKRSI